VYPCLVRRGKRKGSEDMGKYEVKDLVESYNDQMRKWASEKNFAVFAVNTVGYDLIRREIQPNDYDAFYARSGFFVSDFLRHNKNESIAFLLYLVIEGKDCRAAKEFIADYGEVLYAKIHDLLLGQLNENDMTNFGAAVFEGILQAVFGWE